MPGPHASGQSSPTYRLIDALPCHERGPAATKEAPSGKVVLIGSNLPEEDRKRTPDGFMRQSPASPGEGTDCTLGRLGASHAESGTTPGVFVHAAAVQSVMTGNLVRPLPLLGRAAAAVLASLGGSLLGFVMTPWIAIVGVVSLAVAFF